MKRKINLLGYVIFALFVTLTSCSKKETIESDTPVVADDSDPIAYDYFIWYDTNMNNAIFGSGQSVFYFVNNPGTNDENKNYVIDDTTVTISRRYLDFDSCQFFKLDTFPGKLLEFNNIISVSCNDMGSQPKSKTWVRFPTSFCRVNGSTVSNSPIEVVDNQVSILGNSFSVNDPSTFGPPSLASSLAQSINNPPSAPTAAQVDALQCDKILGCYFNSREIHVLISKNKVWTVNNISYHRARTYLFGFSHYWYYDCPDGPLERGMFCSVCISYHFWIDGTLLSYSSIEATHYHAY
jgi:hypothetical protein